MQDIILQDEQHRQAALDPTQSFIVQAPAGSGKTELLTQRVLTLLAHVNAPEEILAITFTKKASAEMRARIIHSLKKAQTEPEPTTAHAKKTWSLAKKVLQRDQDLNWNLVTNPNRLRIQTIDSFNASLIKHLPILSHFGAPPEITKDAYPLYLEAVQEFLSHLEENVAWADAIATLLLHMDNDLNKVQDLLINMLQKRDQWLPYIMIDAEDPSLRQELEKHLASVVADALNNIKTNFPHEHSAELLTLGRYAAFNLKQENPKASNILHCLELTELPNNDKPAWSGLSELLLTKEFTWRKRIDKSTGFPAPSNAKNKEEKASFTEMKQRITSLIEKFHNQEKLLHAFKALSSAPASQYQETQWKALQALYSVLRVVVAQLKVVFQNHGKIDYIENAQAALMALGGEEAPTDLALALDYQIRHILIDEFQDTSNSQYRLIQKLTTGWEPNDGRTLFVVGDPMQSIYRFREAEVGLFIRARQHGIGHIKLIPLTLSLNFRSTAVIVEWVNKHFQTVLPAHEDIGTGAVSYCHSVTTKEALDNSSVILHSFANDDAAQAEKIVRLIQQTQSEKPDENIAILVRSRTHLEYIIPHLKKHNIPYRAIDIDPLDSRPLIQDMMALTRALLHPGDRIAWLSVLRAPWCGLSLNDLLILDDNKPLNTIWQQLQNANLISKLTEDGQQRLARVLPVLKTKMAERRRFSLRLWIESAWLSLGGPACVEQASDLEDIASYLNLLEELDIGCDIENLDNLDNCVSRLFAAPNNQPNINLQIMTIHNAKGLEFDTVILPHLERKSPNDAKQLLLWMEQPRAEADNALILAPVHAIGDENDSIYDYIRRQHHIKSDYESGRLLYVAVTRAKKHLHLFFTLKQDEDQTIHDLKPANKSLLEKLWPAIKDNFAIDQLQKIEMPNDEAVQRTINRLNIHWVNPVKEIAPINRTSFHQKAPGFYLGEDDPRYVGTVVHMILQQMQRFGIPWWRDKSLDAQTGYLRAHLLRLGMLRNHIDAAIETVLAAISNTMNDARGQWILHLHPESQSEYALTAVFDNVCELLVIDRTFIDDLGTRWIIDYKTAFFDGKDLEKFLLAEKKLYQDKMDMYRQAFSYLDDKSIKLGLYFPLVPAWLEWEFETICA